MLSSPSNRTWAKFFLLSRMLVMGPQLSKISRRISSVMFSGRPPTKMVRQPGGRSRVDGGGASVGRDIIRKLNPIQIKFSEHLDRY